MAVSGGVDRYNKILYNKKGEKEYEKSYINNISTYTFVFFFCN